MTKQHFLAERQEECCGLFETQNIILGANEAESAPYVSERMAERGGGWKFEFSQFSK